MPLLLSGAATDLVISAHGVGGGKDLPLPPQLAIAGAVAALVVSFTVLALAWRTPRWEGRTGRPAPAWLGRLVDAPWFVLLLRAVGLVMFGYVLVAVIAGQDLQINPAFGMFMVLLWVGIVPVSLLFGPVWKAISPARTLTIMLSRLSGNDAESGMFRYPTRLGYWPAAFGLFAFVWFELVYSGNNDLSSVRVWILLWLAALVMGGVLFGTTWTKHVDPFEVYSSLVAKLSIWGRWDDGRLVVRSPLANLATIKPTPGLAAVTAVLFGSTGFDSFKESPPWLKFIQTSDVNADLMNNVMLIVFCVGVGLLFAAGSMATGVGPEVRRRDLPNIFAHSVVPIIVGYIIAHYLTMFVEYGQQTLIYMSDPLSNGSDILGTANLRVNYWLTAHPTVVATTKALAVVGGHVLGVIAAHDRAIALLPKRHQLTGQLALLATMVLFTGGGLYLLFAA